MSVMFYLGHSSLTTLPIFFNNTQGVKLLVLAPVTRYKFFIIPRTKALSSFLIQISVSDRSSGSISIVRVIRWGSW